MSLDFSETDDLSVAHHESEETIISLLGVKRSVFEIKMKKRKNSSCHTKKRITVEEERT